MKTEWEREVLLSVFDILCEREVISEEECQRLKLSVKMEEIKG